MTYSPLGVFDVFTMVSMFRLNCSKCRKYDTTRFADI